MSPSTVAGWHRRGASQSCAVLIRRAALITLSLLALAGCGSSTRHPRGSRAPRAGITTPVVAAPALSPAGFPLGRAPFALEGLSETPSANAVDVEFRRPPRAGLLVDLRSGRVLWQLHPLRRVAIASLTKMITALVAARALAPRAPVLIRHDDVEVPGSKVGVLPVGRRVPFDSMLYGLMLPSGNDAAYAIAEAVSGSAARFVRLMNEQAARLGLACSRFASPSGFVDARNFSCAADLAVLARLDLANPRIARVARTHYAVMPFPIKGGKLYLTNNNPLFRYAYPGLTGLKTGYTEAAGRCLVATATRHGISLVAILLHSPGPASQAKKLLDSAFAHVYHLPRVPEEPVPPLA